MFAEEWEINQTVDFQGWADQNLGEEDSVDLASS